MNFLTPVTEKGQQLHVLLIKMKTHSRTHTRARTHTHAGTHTRPHTYAHTHTRTHTNQDTDMHVLLNAEVVYI